VNPTIFAKKNVNLVKGVLARVRHFRSLNRISQEHGVPVSFLQKGQLWFSDVEGNTVNIAVSDLMG